MYKFFFSLVYYTLCLLHFVKHCTFVERTMRLYRAIKNYDGIWKYFVFIVQYDNTFLILKNESYSHTLIITCYVNKIRNKILS